MLWFFGEYFPTFVTLYSSPVACGQWWLVIPAGPDRVDTLISRFFIKVYCWHFRDKQKPYEIFYDGPKNTPDSNRINSDIETTEKTRQQQYTGQSRKNPGEQDHEHHLGTKKTFSPPANLGPLKSERSSTKIERTTREDRQTEKIDVGHFYVSLRSSTRQWKPVLIRPGWLVVQVTEEILSIVCRGTVCQSTFEPLGCSVHLIPLVDCRRR